MNDFFNLPPINFHFNFSFNLLNNQNENQMLKYFELLERLIGHIAWPTVVLIIFIYFKDELKSIIKRLKSAEIKDFKFELEDKIENVKKDAINFGVTMYYPHDTIQRQFNPKENKTKETQILDAWKKIEAKLFSIDDRNGNKNLNDSINYLVKNGKLQKYLANIILDLRELRNIVVHKENPKISEEDFQNWISISKSVIDRLN